ncbi:MAG: DUF4214 domain-containing protein [Acidimicrobiales bacterium]|nr:DUF4214 domain-containing protein [Acidimicrobiales bacterium]
MARRVHRSPRRPLAAMLLVALLSTTLAAAGLAVTPADPAAAAATALTPAFRISSPQTGYHPTFSGESFSSPAVGDVTGDGLPEVVVGGVDGHVVVASTVGVVLARFWTGAGIIQSAPTLVDISGDGVADILTSNVNGDVVAFSGNGTQLFRKRTCTYPGKPCDVFATPSVVDLDTDGDLEIVTSSNDHYLHAWHLDGSYVSGFPVYLQDTTWSSPAIADLDGDGFPEIVVIVDVDYGTAVHVGCPQFGAALNIVTHTGAIRSRTCLPGEIVMASPAIADIDADGALEIVVGSGVYFSAIGQPVGPSRRMHLFDHRGVAQPGWPVDIGGTTLVSPAVGQLDGDAPLEIATSSDTGEVRVYEADGSLRWSSCARGQGFTCPVGFMNAVGSPVSIADVDNDGAQEVVSVVERTLQVRNGGTGAVEASALVSSSGAYVNRSQPTVAVIGGQTHLLVSFLEEQNGDHVRGAGDGIVVQAFRTGTGLGAADWPMFRRNAQRTGSVQTAWAGTRAFDSFLNALYLDFLGRPVDEGARRYWSGHLASGLPRVFLAYGLARSAEWAGGVMDGLYTDVLGRPPEASGRTYWAGRLQDGTRVASVAAELYGSPEYYANAGGTDTAFVSALYRAILQREPEGGGLEYWVGRLGAGVPRQVLAEQLFLSYESNARRVTALYQRLLGRGTDAGGLDHWARYLTVHDDLVLAAMLAGSEEYLARSASR